MKDPARTWNALVLGEDTPCWSGTRRRERLRAGHPTRAHPERPSDVTFHQHRSRKPVAGDVRIHEQLTSPKTVTDMPNAEYGEGLGRQGGRGAAREGAPPALAVLCQGMSFGEYLRPVVGEQKLHCRLPCVHVSALPCSVARAGQVRGVQANEVRDPTLVRHGRRSPLWQRCARLVPLPTHISCSAEPVCCSTGSS
jgi:hypothetical protein